jgi:hypothetical protein
MTDPADAARRRPAVPWLPLAAVLTVGGLVRWPFAAHKDVWFDEAFTWRLVTLPWAELVAGTAADVHPPLYYLLAKGWAAAAGGSLYALRAVSVGFGLVTVTGAYAVAAELWRSAGRAGVPARRFGLLAAAAVAVSPYQIAGDTDARMYPLYSAELAFAAWFFLRTLAAPGRAGNWVGLAGCLTAAVYTHNYALFVAAAFLVCHAAAAARRPAPGRGRFARRAAATYLAVGLAYLPWAAVLAGQVGRVRAGYWIPPLRPTTVGRTVCDLVVPAAGLDGTTGVLAAAGILLAVVVFVGGRGGAAAAVAALAVLPIALPAAVSAVVPVWSDRYFRFSHLALTVAVLFAAGRVRPAGLRAGLWAAFLAAELAGLAEAAGQLSVTDDRGIRRATDEVLRLARPGDAVLVGNPHVFLPCSYFLSARLPTYLAADAEVRHYSGEQVVRADEIAPARPGRRVWYIADTTFTYPPAVQGGALVHVAHFWPNLSSKYMYSVQLYAFD